MQPCRSHLIDVVVYEKGQGDYYLYIAQPMWEAQAFAILQKLAEIPEADVAVSFNGVSGKDIEHARAQDMLYLKTAAKKKILRGSPTDQVDRELAGL